MSNEDNLVIDIFKEISLIPRCSGNEKNISNFIKNKYKKLGFDVKQDKFYNIFIKKPASVGYEDKPGVILQAHMDMVCEKAHDSNHDFEKDPIELKFDGDYMYANKTTLGADDGIGLATALALLEDEDVKHPNLEVVITTSEETGMDGAIGFDKSLLKGQYMINIDSDEEGFLTASSAGGTEGKFSLDVERGPINPNNTKTYEIDLRGLKGGHSGAQIANIHVNAIKLAFDILEKIRIKVPFSLVKFDSGTKHNAIPNSAEIHLVVENENENLLLNVFEEVKSEIIENNLKREPDIEISIKEENREFKVAITENSFKKVNSLVQLIPHGVNTMNDEMDIPESSDNLAIIHVDNSGLEGIVSLRSSNYERLEELKNKINENIEYLGGKIEFNQGYPGWEFREESKLREVIVKAYKKVTGEDMVVNGIHAGLECGLFAEALPDLDIVSLGPNLYDIHTINERASLSSIDRIYKTLVETLKDM